MKTPIALDIETSGEPDEVGRTAKDVAVDHKRNRLVGLGYYVSDQERGYLTNHDEIRTFLQSIRNTHLHIWCNGKFDQKTIAEKLHTWVPNHWDVQRGAALLPQRPPSLALDALVYKFFGETTWKSEDDLRDPAALRLRCLEDCRQTLRLYGYEVDHLTRVGQLKFFHDFYMPLTDLLARMEFRGIAVDTEEFKVQWRMSLAELTDWEKALNTKYGGLAKELVEAKIEEWKSARTRPPTQDQLLKKYAKEAFNWRSWQQVLWLLKTKLGFPCRRWDQKKKKEVDSVDDEVLASYKGQHPIIEDILKHRELAKLEGYFPQWELATTEGRIYSHFNEEGAARTGRLSSSGPNLQQVPKGDCRKIIVARPGFTLYDVDLSQIEPKMLAHRSRDHVMMRAVSGEDDLYSVLIKEAKQLPETPAEIRANRKADRDQGKVLLLSKMYGAGAFKIARQLGITPDEAKDLMQRLDQVTPGIQDYTKELLAQVEREGSIETLLGRKLWLSPELVFSRKQHVNVLNYDIQGSAGDYNSLCHIYLDRWITKHKFPAYLVLLVHDEGLYEVCAGREKEFDEVVKYVMCELLPTQLKLCVPIQAKSVWGTTWAVKE